MKFLFSLVLGWSVFGMSANASPLCRQLQSTCEMKCSQITVYNYDERTYEFNTDAKQKCMDACREGKRMCEFSKDDAIDPCKNFEYHCKMRAPYSVYSYTKAKSLNNTNIRSEVSKICQQTTLYCFE